MPAVCKALRLNDQRVYEDRLAAAGAGPLRIDICDGCSFDIDIVGVFA
jgi:hypothetical protein